MVLKGLFKVVFASAIVFLLIAILPNLLDIDPKPVSIKPCPAFEGNLKVNKKLDDVEKILEKQIIGAESITSYKGDLYTGLADGRIVRINKKNEVQTIAQIKKCDGIWEEHICGRPLGLRFDDQGYLYVANAYLGLLKINIQNGHIQTIYSTQTEVDGKKSMLINDLDISKNGDIYFSDSDGKWPLKELAYLYLESAPNGRVLHWNPKTKETKVLVDGMVFTNGIQLSPDEDFLLIGEAFKYRIKKYHLKGPKKGQLEDFADTPGVVDNIRLNPRGNYWVGQCSTRLPGEKAPIEILGNQLLFRRILGRSVHIFQSLIWYIKTNIVSSVFLDQLWYWTAHAYPYVKIGAPKYGLILELDQKGQIVRSLHSPNGSMYFISEVHEVDNELYLGSPWHDYIGKLKI